MEELQEIMKYVIGRAILNKVDFTEDVEFLAEVKITVDKKEAVSFIITEWSLKENAHLYQKQFSGLLENANIGMNRKTNTFQTNASKISTLESEQRMLESHSLEGERSTLEGERSVLEGERSTVEDTYQNGQGELGRSEERDSNQREINRELVELHSCDFVTDREQQQSQQKVTVVDSATQTDEAGINPALKRKPRKSTNQQKKNKSATGSAMKICSPLPREPEVVDIKMEVISDDERGNTASSVTIVSPLPPTDLQTSTGNHVPCPLCPTQFRSQKAVETHLRVMHDVGNVYMCQVSSCQEMCQSNTALHQHMNDIHGVQEVMEAPPESPPKKKRGRKPKNLNKDIPEPMNETVTSPTVRKSGRKKTAKQPVGRKPGRKKSALKEAHKTKPAVPAVKGVLKCDECPKEYASKRALNRHVRTAHDVKKYQCDICGKVFTSKETLYHHRRGIHSESKPYKCSQCDASFNFNHSLRLHRLKHSGIRPFECKECNKTYLTSNHLKMHMEGVHGGKKNHECKICGKCFSYTTSLKVHEMTHGDYRPYRCTVCGQGFVNSHSLKYHKESKHSHNTWFECDLCGKKYKTEFLMKTHRRRHTADGTRYMCDICGRQFMYKSTLEIHAAVHSDEKSFQCSTCGKSFKTYATLYSHQYVHKSESPYNCADCGKSFKTKERCKAHQKRHSGLKPFECDQCGRCFPDKGGLSKHTKTVHCDIKMFVCDICGKACSRADNLRVHMKIHNKAVDASIPGRKLQVLPIQDKTLTVMKSPVDLAQKDQQGQDFLNISPNSSPSHTVTLPRIYSDRADPSPFIPSVTDPLAIPQGSALAGHGILLTAQETELGCVANSVLHPSTSLVTAPTTTQAPPSGSSYMYMWPYLPPQHQSDQTGSNNQYF